MNTDNNDVSRILDILKNNSLAQINEKILLIEQYTKRTMRQIESDAKEQNISIQVDESSNLSRAIGRELGIDYLKPSYKAGFNAYTCQCKAMCHLFYAIRDTIRGYYTWINADVTEKTIKLFDVERHIIPDNIKDNFLSKEYANGNEVYFIGNWMLERIAIVREIDSIISPHN